MSKLELIRAMVAYNYDTWEKVWDSILALPEAKFDTHVDYSHGSLKEQMLHATLVDARWLRGLKGDPAGRQFTLSPEATLNSANLRAAWEGVASDFRAYTTRLTEEKLEEVTLERYRGPAWQVIIHVMNHGTDHRAQVLRILHDFGAPTFDQDMIYHLWR